MKDYSDYKNTQDYSKDEPEPANSTGSPELRGLVKRAVERFNSVKEAAENGSADDQYELGQYYDSGLFVGKDPAKAAFWYEKAAKQGHVQAQFDLGVSYATGDGVEEDAAKAVYWYQKAAEQGDAKAQFNLALRCAQGRGISKDIAKAAYWYQKAADQGHAGAQNNLGLCYLNGVGVTKDLAKAAQLFEKAAEQGDADAQYNLGARYFQGEGVSRDYAKAAEWFEKAAEQKVEGAADALERARKKLKEAEEAKKRAAEEAERQRIQKEADKHDVSMEIGAVVAAAVFLAGIYGFRWAEGNRELGALLRILLQFVTIAASALGGCGFLALLAGSFSELLAVPGGIAGLIGGLCIVFHYEYPDVYHKAALFVFALVALALVRIVFKRLRK